MADTLSSRGWAVVLLATLTVGCAPNLCDRAPPCPNDRLPTEQERAQCRATLEAQSSSACYGELYTYTDCATYGAAVCGGNGTFDARLTATKAENVCVNQRASLAACCVKNPSATACRGIL